MDKREEINKIVIDVAKDHYWDSFIEVKDMIIPHIRGFAPIIADKILSIMEDTNSELQNLHDIVNTCPHFSNWRECSPYCKKVEQDTGKDDAIESLQKEIKRLDGIVFQDTGIEAHNPCDGDCFDSFKDEKCAINTSVPLSDLPEIMKGMLVALEGEGEGECQCPVCLSRRKALTYKGGRLSVKEAKDGKENL
jgi:hypothetical protein